MATNDQQEIDAIDALKFRISQGKASSADVDRLVVLVRNNAIAFGIMEAQAQLAGDKGVKDTTWGKLSVLAAKYGARI